MVKEITSDKKNARSLSSTIEKNKGRRESRSVYVFDSTAGIQGQWAGAKSLVRVDRQASNGKKQNKETSYYISSLSMGADRFNEGIRAHWGIENKLHWVKDATYKEDSSKINSGNAPENMSIIRNIAINILRKNGYKNLRQASRLLANDIDKIKQLLE